MSISTKKGDDGFTGIPGTNERLRKDHPYMEFLGELDELDAHLALCAIALKTGGSPKSAELIEEVKIELTDVMIPLAAELFGRSGKKTAPAKLCLNTGQLDQHIAALEKENPVTGFVKTWSKPASAAINTARTICRRCERRSVTALQTCAACTEFLPWLNRLSDLLFLLAASEEKD